MDTSAPPRWFHDVIGVAFIVHEAGSNPEEAFRFPWYNSSRNSTGPLGLFDQISPKSLANLVKPHKYLTGELLEIVFRDVRLICRPIELEPDMNDELRTATFYNLVFAVFSEFRPPRRLYPSAPLPRRLPLKASVVAAAAASGAGAAVTPQAAGGAGDGVVDSPLLRFCGESTDGEGGEGGGEGGGGSGGGGFADRGPGVDLALLRGALMMASRAMHHEEILNGFISESGRELLKTQEELDGITDFANRPTLQPVFSENCERAQPPKVEIFFGGRFPSEPVSAAERRDRREQQLRASVLEDSQLAQDMKTLFIGLTSGAPFEMTINRWSALSINVSVERDIPDPKRYETLILREEEAITLSELPRDSSPQIRLLIEMADPLKTFDELAYTSEIELSQMFRLARHMVFWGEGRVIDTLSKANRYRVSRAARRALMPSSPISAEFSAKFPRRVLVEEVTRFGSNRSLDDIIKRTKPSLRGGLVPMLIYLLRKDLLVQMQRYIILRIPAPPDPSAFAYTVTTATATASVRDHENPVGVTAERRQGTDGQGQGQSQGQAQGRDHGDGEKREVDEGISSLRRNSEDSGVGCSSGEGGGDAQDRLSWSAAASAGASSSSGRWGEWSSRTGGGGGAEASGGAGVGAAGGDAGGDGGWGQVYGPMVGYDADAKGLFDAPTLEPFEEEYLRERDDRSETSKLMRRFAPFFRGKLHLREIVWRLEIDDMNAVDKVLKHYGDVLMEIWRPAQDPSPDQEV